MSTLKENTAAVDLSRYTQFLVTNAYGWGMAATLPRAKKNAKAAVPHSYRASEQGALVYYASLVTEDTAVDGGGGVNFMPDAPPIKLGPIS